MEEFDKNRPLSLETETGAGGGSRGSGENAKGNQSSPSPDLDSTTGAGSESLFDDLRRCLDDFQDRQGGVYDVLKQWIDRLDDLYGQICLDPSGAATISRADLGSLLRDLTEQAEEIGSINSELWLCSLDLIEDEEDAA